MEAEGEGEGQEALHDESSHDSPGDIAAMLGG